MKDKPKLPWVILLIVLVIYCAFLAFIPRLYPSIEQRGQFGDTFGALSSLFTALGFVGLLFTIHQNNAELMKRDQEAAQERDILLKQTQEMVRSNDALIAQLKLMQVSAKLQALPQLIEAELLHLELHHVEQLRQLQESRIRSVTDHGVKAMIQKAERIFAISKKSEANKTGMEREELSAAMAGGNVNHYRCFLENLQALYRYKRDLLDSYKQL